MLRPDHERPTEENAPHEGTRDQLLKENEHLRAGVAYLEKSRPFFRRRSGRRKRKTQIVRQLRQHPRLPVLLKAAELARSTFYYQSKALDGGERHEELKAKIKLCMSATRTAMATGASPNRSGWQTRG
nr:hypothetical protein [Paraburkholderia youngii]